jgi:hypothetical protein
MSVKIENEHNTIPMMELLDGNTAINEWVILNWAQETTCSATSLGSSERSTRIRISSVSLATAFSI